MKKRTKKIEEQIKSLTWTKFWQYKFSELMAVLIFVFIPYSVGIFLWKVHPAVRNFFFEGFTEPISLIGFWLGGFFGILAFVIVVGVIVLFVVINWKKAEENAEEEVTGETRYSF